MYALLHWGDHIIVLSLKSNRFLLQIFELYVFAEPESSCMAGSRNHGKGTCRSTRIQVPRALNG